MKDKEFQECLKAWENSDGHTPIWESLAEKFNYGSGEILRSSFKRERKRRGITRENSNSSPKIAVFDIETAPMTAYVFDLWEQNISPQQVLADSYMLCWCAKYLNDSKVFGKCITPSESKRRNDKLVVESLWHFLNDVDIIIGQNIRGFDLKRANTRFLYWGMQPISNLQIIDTYSTAKANFSFPSNSLRYINSFLGITKKLENEGFALWKGCVEGDETSLDKMFEYCGGDVVATEDLYYKLRPYIKNHPNLALYNELEDDQCPNCASIMLSSNGYYYGQGTKYESLRCEGCGAVHRKKQNLIPKEKRKKVLK